MLILVALFLVGAVWTFFVMAQDHQGAAVLFLIFCFLANAVSRDRARINGPAGRWRGRA